jgi:hypothetical protein
VVISNDPYAPVTIGPGEVVPTDQPTAPYLDAVVAYGFRGSTASTCPVISVVIRSPGSSAGIPGG